MDYLFGKLVEGSLISRENRFRAEVEVNKERHKAHIPNSGRLQELLLPGSKIWLREAAAVGRKTPFSLLLVEKDGRLICIDSHLANQLFEIWLRQDKIAAFREYLNYKKEFTIGNSRIDFFLEFPDANCLVEVKSVNLFRDYTALFPDAPTGRGVKHLQELLKYAKAGQKAAVIFIVMGQEAVRFMPNYQTDPLFANALAQAIKGGVQVCVYKCEITREGITLAGEIPCLV